MFALAAAALGAPQAQMPSNDISRLNAADEAIVDAPFAPAMARDALRTNIASLEARRAARLLLPGTLPDSRSSNSMGWSIPDQDYWQSIPEPARTIPVDWSRFPSVRYTNSQLGGVREVRLAIGTEYDQWLLSDPTHRLSACISVNRSTRKVYFMEIARSDSPLDAGKAKWVFHAGFDNCYSCHPSGPRAIRPLDERGVNTSALAQFNRRILGYHACDFGNTLGPRGEPIVDRSCMSCHNGVNRGKLYSIHQKSVDFKKDDELTMPAG